MVRIQFLYEKEQNMNAAEIIKKDLDAIYIGNLSTVDEMCIRDREKRRRI